ESVTHPVPAAEITHGTESGGYPHTDAERPQKSAASPFLLQLAHAPLHGDRHQDASLGIFGDTFRFWIAEEQQHCIANEFIDGRAMLKRNHGHLGEVMIEYVRQLFRF